MSDGNGDPLVLSRRSLLKASLPVLAVGFGLSSTGCGGANIPTRTVMAGSVDDFAIGQPQRLEQYDVYLVRTEQGLAAISGQCTHQGCGVTPADGGFHCGCHGSHFSADGTVEQGPATRDLPWFAVRIEGGQVTVDPTQEVAKGTYTAI